jgi:hypothetical protein
MTEQTEQLDLGGMMTLCEDHRTMLANCIHRHSVRVRQDVDSGLRLKEEGMAKALKPDALAEWKERFRSTVERWASEGKWFTSEDVTDYLGMPVSPLGMNKNNAVGAMMNGLARRKVIVKTTMRLPSHKPSSHGAELVVWKGADR